MPCRHCGQRTHYGNCHRATHRQEGPRETQPDNAKRALAMNKGIFTRIHSPSISATTSLSIANAIKFLHAFGLVNNPESSAVGAAAIDRGKCVEHGEEIDGRSHWLG